MKRFFYIFIFILGIQQAFAQDKNILYLTYGFSNATPIYNKELEGTGGYDGKGTSSFGIRLIGKSRKVIAFETGLDFISCKFDMEPAFHPGIDMTPSPEKMSLLSVPVYANLRFLRYFFINGGAFLDFEVSKKNENTVSDQTGIGFGLGLGGRYTFKKMSVILNPFFQRHSYLSLNQSGASQSLINSGFRVGLGYVF